MAASKARAFFYTIGVIAAVVAAPAPAFSQEQLVGKWYGTAGTPLDRIPIGFEFKRDAAGKTRAYLYSPTANFYGLDAGLVEIDSGKFRLRSWVLTFTQERDSILGTMYFNRVPVILTRTRSLPTEAPMPKFPAPRGPKWQTRLGAPVYAAAALRSGVAYVGTGGGLFHAIDASTGKFIWTFTAGRPIHGAATVTDSAVYFVSDIGYLFKLKRSDGTEVWRYNLGDERVARVLQHQVIENSGDFNWDLTAPTPVVHDGAVIVGSGDGTMHAVDAISGQHVWRFESGRSIRGSAVVDGTRVVFGNAAGLVIALDRRTGAKLWERGTSGPIVTSVARVGQRIVAGNRYGVLAAIDIATGRREWAMQMWGSSAESEATESGDTLFYFGSSDLRRIALTDVRDGRVLWRSDVYGWAWPRPVLAGDLLLVSTVGASPYQIRHFGALTALDAKTGRIVWRFGMQEPDGSWGHGFVAPAAVDDRHIVIGGLNGALYGFTCCN